MLFLCLGSKKCKLYSWVLKKGLISKSLPENWFLIRKEGLLGRISDIKGWKWGPARGVRSPFWRLLGINRTLVWPGWVSSGPPEPSVKNRGEEGWGPCILLSFQEEKLPELTHNPPWPQSFSSLSSNPAVTLECQTGSTSQHCPCLGPASTTWLKMVVICQVN